MSGRHRRRSPVRLWWTVAGGNVVLGMAVLTAVVLSSEPDASEATTQAAVATATSASLTPEQTRSDVGEGWATTAAGAA